MQGHTLAQHRINAAVGQAHVGSMLGVTGPVISTVERGKLGPMSAEFSRNYINALNSPTPCYKGCGCTKVAVHADR